MRRFVPAALLAVLTACAGAKPKLEDLPAALRDANRHPRFPASAFVTAIGFGKDRDTSELDAKQKVSLAVASQIDAECRSEMSAGPQGEKDVSECKTKVVSKFSQADLIVVDASLTRNAGDEWRAFAHLDRRKAEGILALEQKPSIEQLVTLWEKGEGTGPDAMQADCEAERLKAEVKRGLAVRRSLVGPTADQAKVATAEQAAARRKGERSGQAEVSLMADDELGKKLVRAIHKRLDGTSLKVREGDGACTVGMKLMLRAERSAKETAIGQMCTLALHVAGSFCGEGREGFTLKGSPVNALNASDLEMACRKAADKIELDKIAAETVGRVKGALGLSCGGN